MSQRTALVTGASRGIGAAISRVLAQDIDNLVIHYHHNPVPAQALVSELEAAGVKAIALAADIGNEEQVIGLFDQIDAWFGGLDVVVQNAGINSEGLTSVIDLDMDEYDRLHRVNNRGAFLVLREAARRIRNDGRIVALSTTLNRIHSPGFAGYATSKGVVDHLIPILAKEVADRGISVNAVAPSAVDTDLFREGKTQAQIEQIEAAQPTGRIGLPEDIAPLIGFLASPESGWISGQIIGSNGGLA